jgi:hypothetical protein
MPDIQAIRGLATNFGIRRLEEHLP